jgi:hypothetical protein
MNSVQDEWEAIKSGLFWLFASLIGVVLTLALGYFVYVHWWGLLPTFAILAFWVAVALYQWDGK